MSNGDYTVTNHGQDCAAGTMSSRATEMAAMPARKLDEGTRLAMTAIRQRLETNVS